MRTTFNFDGMGALGIGLGIAGTLFAAWQGKKTTDMARKLDISVKSLAKKTPVQVSQDIVNKAVRTAADKKANEAVTRSINSITSGMKESMSKKITTDVGNVYNDLKTGVADKVADEIIKWDMKDMKTEVKSMVVDKAFKELCSASEIGRLLINRGNNGSSLDADTITDVLDQFYYSSDKKEALKMLLGQRD